MRKSGRTWQNRTGASAVEFALVMPFLLMVLFCIVEMSWLLSSQAVLNHATFQAARVASRAKGAGISDAEAALLARNKVEDGFWMGTLKNDDVTVEYDTSGDVAQVKVQTTFKYQPLTGWFALGDLPENLKARAVTPFP